MTANAIDNNVLIGICRKAPLPKANVETQGRDVTRATCARIAIEARVAVRKAAEKGIPVEPIDLRTLAPRGREAVLASAAKTGRVIIAHEAVKEHGPGAEIATVINEDRFGKRKTSVRRLGGAFSAVPFSKKLEMANAPNPDKILDAIETIASQG